MKTAIGNKAVMSQNLTYYVERSGRTQKELAAMVGVATTTFNDWVRGRKYPRIDKIEMLADFFGILKSDLIEDREEMQKNNDILADIVIRARSDEAFRDALVALNRFDSSQVAGIVQMLNALSK